jgi:spore coat polysaccharide biosynthesis protein SpsF (cytidylyltransferase family)
MTARNLETPATPRRSLGDRKRLTIGVVIQARQSSSRFPGKSMTPLAGKPVLQHVIERCKLIKAPIGMKKPLVIVAMPDDPKSEPMGALTHKLKVEHFVGSETNVLERYYQAAIFFKLDYIVRITADCPFISPTICSEVLSLLLWRKCDYTSNCYPELDRSFPKGLDCEAFTMDCLEAAHVVVEHEYEKYMKLVKVTGMDNFKAIIDQLEYHREHVTPWMIEEPQLIRAIVKQKRNDSELNWCVDYPEDIERLENLYKLTNGIYKANKEPKCLEN